MAIRDAKGNLHSEINGRFIEKQEAAGRIDGGDTTTSYYSTEKVTKYLSGFDEIEPAFRSLIRDGKINLTICQGLQDKHILGTNNYRQEIAAGRNPSVLWYPDPQQLVLDYAGTGRLTKKDDGDILWTRRELVTANQYIGYAVAPQNGQIYLTRSFTIHYSDKGVHIVPRREDDNGFI